MSSTRCIGVFLKAPEPGRVKTRLGREIGLELACELYRAFAADTLEWIGEQRGLRRVIFFAPPEAVGRCRELAPRPRRFELRPQRAGDLGHRLQGAFEDLLGRRPGRALIVGTDSPLLGPRHLRAAYEALERRDLVLGPTPDGGYYLVGLRRPAPALFRAIPWSGREVLATTLTRAVEAGLTRELLAPLGDIDTLADLRRLARVLPEAWRRAVATHAKDFPHRTFRWLGWELPLRGKA